MVDCSKKDMDRCQDDFIQKTLSISRKYKKGLCAKRQCLRFKSLCKNGVACHNCPEPPVVCWWWTTKPKFGWHMNPTGWNPISLVVITVKGIEETPQRCSKMLRSEIFLCSTPLLSINHIWCWFRTLHPLLGTSLDNPGDKNQQQKWSDPSLLHLESKINGSKLQRGSGFAFPSRLMIIMMSVSLPASASLIFLEDFPDDINDTSPLGFYHCKPWGGNPQGESLPLLLFGVDLMWVVWARDSTGLRFT